jgi:hypothetical protein
MKIEFENGSVIESVDSGEVIRSPKGDRALLCKTIYNFGIREGLSDNEMDDIYDKVLDEDQIVRNYYESH